jgi:lipase maturation factor 1
VTEDVSSRPTYALTTWLFLRLLGLVYLAAFASLGVQIVGLLGTSGVLPAKDYIEMARGWASHNDVGWTRYFLLPTFGWLAAGDAALRVHCLLGVALSIVLVAGFIPTACLLALWGLYLSLSVIGGEFLSFQWDALLLETGFLAIFLGPATKPIRGEAEDRASTAVLWLLRWLLFRLMFSSGAIKLASGDATWRNLTALSYHYETQPLPTWVGWYANQLPLWFDRVSCLAMFAVELGAPVLIFAPRRFRLAGCAALVGLQVLIAVTGNYGYFNMLTIVLSILLLDDAAISQWTPQSIRSWFDRRRLARIRWRLPRWAPIAVALVLLPPSLGALGRSIGIAVSLPPPFSLMERAVQPFRLVNTYGLFAVMTTSRPEIIIEGSDDGAEWKTYEFRYKPGDPRRRPQFVAPHHPRLDWQMWFAALDRYESNPWFASLCRRLLEGSPAVLALLADNPFPDRPPRFLRAVLYDYHFTTFAATDGGGDWWQRTRLDLYSPVLSATGAERQPLEPR